MPDPGLLSLRAPLVIGVTGHRDLRPEDIDPLKNGVDNILKGLQDKYKSTPLVVLSSLAEGADRLAAAVALNFGARLVVPLPMPQLIYEADFRSKECRDEFHDLLARADYRIEMRILDPHENIARHDPARNRQYEELGKFIARESQILIALWDGLDSHRIGGTAQVKRFQLEGIPDASGRNLQPQELFPVYRIVTPRLCNPSPIGAPFTMEIHYPERFRKGDPEEYEDPEKYYSRIFSNLEEFNHLIQHGGQELLRASRSCKCELIEDAAQLKLSASETLDLERYAAADALAQRFQRRMQNADDRLHQMMFVALACFVVFAHWETHPLWLLATSVGLLGVTYTFYWYSTVRAKIDVKSQDYRAIAEGARVRFFWHLAGIRDSVADNYLGKQRTDLDWIRTGLRGWELESRVAQHRDTPVGERLEQVRNLWIDAQIEYFKKATSTKEKRLKRKEWELRICAGLSILSALAILGKLTLASLCGPQPSTAAEGEAWWMPVLIIATDIFLIAAALLHHHTQQRAYPQHIKQSRWMESIFGTARELIDQKLAQPDLAEVLQYLRELGKEALSENGDWVLLHREHPLELPPP